MNETPRYAYYRNRKIPAWWSDYLPDEKNPYGKSDSLTLQRGTLCDFWHIHSSNKHYNPRGVAACSHVQKMAYDRFGGAFLTPPYPVYKGSNHEKSYNEPDSLAYGNANIDENGFIHIPDARQYYEDVISFMLDVLQEVSRNHFQSGRFSESMFFPNMTDAQAEEARIKAHQKNLANADWLCGLKELLKNGKFTLERFEYGSVKFVCCHSYDDDWFNLNFSFSDIQTNIPEEIGRISVIINIPQLTGWNLGRKDFAKAVKTLALPFCFALRTPIGKDFLIPEKYVSKSLIQTISDACTKAMNEYNRNNSDLIENTNVTPVRRYYPANFFLDNNIGSLNLRYDTDICHWSIRAYNLISESDIDKVITKLRGL